MDYIRKQDALNAIIGVLNDPDYDAHPLSEAYDRVAKLPVYTPYSNKGEWLAEEHAKNLWIPVTERLPEIGKKVLVFAYGHDVLTARLRKETENDYPVFECNGIYLEMAKQERITHWMPLPEAPKDGE